MKTIKIFHYSTALVSLAMLTLFTVSAISTSSDTEAAPAEGVDFYNCTLGEITMFAGNFAPRGWALCNGQLMAIQQNNALFSVLGTTYGGDGRTTFALPELRGRVPVHAGSGPGLTPRPLGQKAGTETNTLSVAQLPSHSHTAQLKGKVRIPASDDSANADFPTNNYMATTSSGSKAYRSSPGTGIYMADPDISGLSVTVDAVGGGQAVNNMPPFQTVNYIICLQGSFPSRS